MTHNLIIDFRSLKKEQNSFYLSIVKLCRQPTLYQEGKLDELIFQLGQEIQFNHDNSEIKLNDTAWISAFLQSLCYYIVHIYNDNKSENRTRQTLSTTILLRAIISHPLFFGSKEQPIFWIDPKEKTTALIALARYTPAPELCQLYLERAKNFYNNLSTTIEHAEKDGFTALNAACKDGNIKTVEILLDQAEKIYGGKKTQGFKKLFLQKNSDGFFPLSTACITGNVSLVKILLVTAESVYDEIEYYHQYEDYNNDFITSYTTRKNSPVYLACKGEHIEILHLLLTAVAKKLYKGTNNWFFHNFIFTLDCNGAPLLDTLCNENKIKSIEVLLMYAIEAYKDNANGFVCYLNSVSHKKYSNTYLILVTASMSAAREVYKENFSKFILGEGAGALLMEHACRTGKVDVVTALLACAESYCKNTDEFMKYVRFAIINGCNTSDIKIVNAALRASFPLFNTVYDPRGYDFITFLAMKTDSELIDTLRDFRTERQQASLSHGKRPAPLEETPSTNDFQQNHPSVPATKQRRLTY